MEADRFERIAARVGPERTARLFNTGGSLPQGAAAMLASEPDGACRFHEGRRCTIHRELGQHALPSACEQFPRIALMDGRGTFVRLSNFCPTAAALLLETSTFAIVPASDTLTLQGRVDGLDAREVLPPLLRPGLLTDLPGYGAWETLGVETLASGTFTAREALNVIDTATRATLEWRPGNGSLADAVRRAFASARPLATVDNPACDLQRFAHAVDSIPRGLRRPAIPRGIEPVWTAADDELGARDAAVQAWLASHLFGNWTAYSASGLATIVEYLRVCLAVVRVELARAHTGEAEVPSERWMLEAIRQADHILHHLTDIPTLTRSLEPVRL